MARGLHLYSAFTPRALQALYNAVHSATHTNTHCRQQVPTCIGSSGSARLAQGHFSCGQQGKPLSSQFLSTSRSNDLRADLHVSFCTDAVPVSADCLYWAALIRVSSVLSPNRLSETSVGVTYKQRTSHSGASEMWNLNPLIKFASFPLCLIGSRVFVDQTNRV